jgi:small subunit ribosomal protein S1
VSEQEEDFATMFEASVKARRFERGQTIDGTIVALGPEVALVSVGGKSEAQIDIAELKDADGDIEFAIGDRIQAVVVSTSGGIMLSRKGVRNAATQRELENAFQAGLAVEGKVESVNKGGYEVRIARVARLLPALTDRCRPHHRPGGTRRQDLYVPDHRVQGRRQIRCCVAAQTARRGTAGER